MPYFSRRCCSIKLIIYSVERKGKTLHLLKTSAKPVQAGRKRKRHEVFDPANDEIDVNMEEAKAADRENANQDGFKDVSKELKRP